MSSAGQNPTSHRESVLTRTRPGPLVAGLRSAEEKPENSENTYEEMKRTCRLHAQVFQAFTSTFSCFWSGQHRFEGTAASVASINSTIVSSTWRGWYIHGGSRGPGCLIRGPEPCRFMFLSAGSGGRSWESHLSFVSVLALRLCQIVRRTRQLDSSISQQSRCKTINPPSSAWPLLFWNVWKCRLRIRAKCVITLLTGLDHAGS